MHSWCKKRSAIPKCPYCEQQHQQITFIRSKNSNAMLFNGITEQHCRNSSFLFLHSDYQIEIQLCWKCSILHFDDIKIQMRDEPMTMKSNLIGTNISRKLCSFFFTFCKSIYKQSMARFEREAKLNSKVSNTYWEQQTCSHTHTYQ